MSLFSIFITSLFLLLLIYYCYSLNELYLFKDCPTLESLHWGMIKSQWLIWNIGQSPSVCVHQSMNNEWQPVIKLPLIYASLMQLFSDALFCWKKSKLQKSATLISFWWQPQDNRFLFAENFGRNKGRHPNQGISSNVYNWKQRWALLFLIIE